MMDWMSIGAGGLTQMKLEYPQAVKLANASTLARRTLVDSIIRRNPNKKAGQRARQQLIKGSAFYKLPDLKASELPRKGTAIAVYPAHDASIAISVDGKIQCVLELERLFGIRYFWPALENAEDVWTVALWQVHKMCDCELGECPTSFDYGAVVLFEGEMMMPRAEYANLPLIVEKVFPVQQWRLVDHHEAHARTGFFLSPFRTALILSYDGGGNDGVFNVYYGGLGGPDLNRLGQHGIDVGQRYAMLGALLQEVSSRNVTQGCKNYKKLDSAFTFPSDTWLEVTLGLDFSLIDHLGWNGKLMAYASLGASWMPQRLVALACKSIRHQRSIARAAQAQFETYVLQLVRTILGEIGSLGLPEPEGIVITGGCGLNVLANQLIHDSIVVNSTGNPMGIYVPAAPNDSGLTVGGVWALVQPVRGQSVQYAGFRLWDGDKLEEVAEAWGAKRLSELGGVEFLAELLSTGPLGEKPVVAVVRGRQEFGPRALGHRSLLAVPDSSMMRDRMNRLKSRQWFRPVALMIADEALVQVFGREVKSPYMSMAPRVRDEVLQDFPALSHLDGTARHQSVGEADEPWIHALLLEVAKHTGLAALINTSFNAKGRPIVNSIRTCFEMLIELRDLDYVLIEDWLFQWPPSA